MLIEMGCILIWLSDQVCIRSLDYLSFGRAKICVLAITPGVHSLPGCVGIECSFGREDACFVDCICVIGVLIYEACYSQ